VLISAVFEAVGQSYFSSNDWVYDIIDNCPESAPQMQSIMRRTGQSEQWVRGALRLGAIRGARNTKLRLDRNDEGGYTWSCGRDSAAEKWLERPDTIKALHLEGIHGSPFNYSFEFSPSVVPIYKDLVDRLRILIYSGDTDSCVPTAATEEFIRELQDDGTIQEVEAWRPWFGTSKSLPYGYVTSFQSPNTHLDFTFATVHLAGHMVPTFQPEGALSMITSFMEGTEFGSRPHNILTV